MNTGPSGLSLLSTSKLFNRVERSDMQKSKHGLEIIEICCDSDLAVVMTNAEATKILSRCQLTETRIVLKIALSQMKYETF
jgi:hypothetical protein